MKKLTNSVLLQSTKVLRHQYNKGPKLLCGISNLNNFKNFSSKSVLNKENDTIENDEMDEDLKLSLFGDSRSSDESSSRSNYVSRLGNDTNGVSYTTYLEKDKHFRRLTEEEISKLKQKYSDVMSPPTIITEYPFDLKTNQPVNSTKPLVSPINHHEYFAVLDKINARVLQRGTTVSKVAVAVSGGGDSMGTAILVKKWSDYLKQKKGIDMEVVALIVDHQIREESEHEMLYVHEVLTKTIGYKNVCCFQCLWPENQKKQQRIARLKRQLIMTSECVSQKIDLLISGHHKQDNIETMIHRVAFSSGINGLNGIPLIYSYCVADATLMLARPGLVFDCNELKAVCAQFNVKWVEDPKNNDEREFRAIIRSRLGLLYQSGVSPSNFYNFLLTLGAIRHIMLRESLNFYNRYVRFDDELGFAGIYFYSLEKTAEFVASNALNSLIQYVTNREFPVTLGSIKNVVRYLPSTKRSLGGCLLVPDKKVLYVIRDTGPLRRKKHHTTIRFTDKGIVWDNRFFIQIFQYNKMNIPEENITYSKKLSLEKQPEYDNILIPNYDGKVDTDPNGIYKIRPFTETDHKYFGEHYPLMMKAAIQYPNYLTRSFPVIEDSKGILGIPFLGWKRCVNIFWYIKFLPSRQKFVPGEADSLYDFVKLFSKK